MSALPCGHYTWTGTEVSTIPPSASDPEPGYVPPVAPEQAGAQGEEFHVWVNEFPVGRPRGVLQGAVIESLTVRSREAGGNQVEISVPASTEIMRIFGDPVPGAFNSAGRQLYHLKNSISRELLVGSTATGKTMWRFMIRDEARIEAGRLRITGVGYIGGFTSDRVVGAPTRINRIGTRIGSFEAGNLTGWRKVGAVTAGVETGGLTGTYCAWVKGVPNGRNFLEAKARFKIPANTPWGFGDIAGLAYVKLPNIGPEIDDYGLVTIAVTDISGRQVWPKPNVSDAKAGVVTSDMVRGDWDNDQVVGVGYTDQPPFDAYVKIRLHPTSPTEKTYYDGAGIIIGEATGTGFPRDRIFHVGILLDDAQRGRMKSSAGINLVFGEESGIVENAVWPHVDGQPLYDAIEGVAGVEVWDYPAGGRAVKIAKRRGQVRHDLVIHDWDILGQPSWQVDPGAQRTTIRATSSAGSVWGGADVGASDTSQSNGQVIDVILAGPQGMRPNKLERWVAKQLADLKLLPATTTLLVRWELGMRLSVGDTVRVALQGGDAAAHVDWMRVDSWQPDLVGRRWVRIDLGTDPDLGGK